MDVQSAEWLAVAKTQSEREVKKELIRLIKDWHYSLCRALDDIPDTHSHDIVTMVAQMKNVAEYLEDPEGYLKRGYRKPF